MSICPGSSAQMSVAATGTGPLSYQWYLDGLPILGADQSSYQAGAPGAYTVAVSNACGSTTSLLVARSIAEPRLTAG